QHEVTQAIAGTPTMAEFVRRLEASGVGVRANIQSTGRVAGLSFSVGGASFKGSQLGRNFAWKALAQRISYEPERDAEILREASARTTSAAVDPSAVRSVGAQVDARAVSQEPDSPSPLEDWNATGRRTAAHREGERG